MLVPNGELEEALPVALTATSQPELSPVHETATPKEAAEFPRQLTLRNCPVADCAGLTAAPLALLLPVPDAATSP